MKRQDVSLTGQTQVSANNCLSSAPTRVVLTRPLSSSGAYGQPVGEHTGQSRAQDGSLRSADVVSESEESQRRPGAVENRKRSTGISITRLPHRARVDQVPVPGVQLERPWRANDLGRDLSSAVELENRWKMSVAEEDEPVVVPAKNP